VEEKIVKIFKENADSYVSGEELSKRLGVTRTSIWKHIENLRRLGYEIDATPHLGYRLTGVPDKFLPQEITLGLGTKIIAKFVYSFTTAESTNELAYKFAEEGKPDGTVVLAEKQTKGKGRMGRKWVSPEGGIYLSLILRPELPPNQTPKITLLAAIGVARALRSHCNIAGLIKWPNDILVGSKKICGILTELKAEQDTTQFLIIGIGVNVNIDKKDLPQGSTSVSNELGETVSKVKLAQNILRELELQYNIFKKKGFDSIRTEWRNLSAMLGKRVKVKSHKGAIEGQASDIDDNGSLVVRLDNGFLEKITAGDVILLR